MKRTMVGMVSCVLLLAVFMTSAFAYNYYGNIWTNHPESFGMGTYGYYCTAAVNFTSGSSQWAYAASYLNGYIAYADTKFGANNTAIANSGSIRPDGGYGAYGYGLYEDGHYVDQKFYADDYPIIQ